MGAETGRKKWIERKISIKTCHQLHAHVHVCLAGVGPRAHNVTGRFGRGVIKFSHFQFTKRSSMLQDKYGIHRDNSVACYFEAPSEPWHNACVPQISSHLGSWHGES